MLIWLLMQHEPTLPAVPFFKNYFMEPLQHFGECVRKSVASAGSRLDSIWLLAKNLLSCFSSGGYC